MCVCKTGHTDCVYSGYTDHSGTICFDNVSDAVNWDIYAGDNPPTQDCLHAYTLNYNMICPGTNQVNLCLPMPCMHPDLGTRKGANQEWQLLQNYPNPFNPTTEISYSVASTELVKISVYDLIGRKVAELVNEYKDAGTYSVVFDASTVSSGLYFYRMEAGSYVETKKMLLLK